MEDIRDLIDPILIPWMDESKRPVRPAKIDPEDVVEFLDQN